ncbi:MAG TPA: YCF48-related protein [Candidatus Acidoferrum sp.]|nr:YCF48-related protein [Candidatus Acidoferrum sp.]
MQSVPQIVRDRLRAAAIEGAHVDADVLTAFAERSLSDRERSRVLDHLAGCSECREVVALALPPSETATTVLTPARRGWLSWPTFRWGFAAAGIVIIAVVGTVEIRRSSQPATMVAKQSRNQNVGLFAQPQPPANTTTPEDEGNEHKLADKDLQSAGAAKEHAKVPEPSLTARAIPPSATIPQNRNTRDGRTVGGPIAGSPSYGPNMPTQFQQQMAQQSANQLQALPQPSPSGAAKQQSVDAFEVAKIPPSSQSVEVQSEAAAIQSSPSETRAETQTNQLSNQSSSRLSNYYAPGPIGKAKPATGSGNGAAAVAPRWTINSAGGLQRSFDQGNSWQDVDVNATAARPAELKAMAPAKTEGAKEAYAEKKAPMAPNSAPVFRTVTATGVDVWAGGSNGALFHSLDGGNHWSRVVPSSFASTLTGDIVGIEFTDPQHGKIATSSGEVWTTADDGVTWQKL